MWVLCHTGERSLDYVELLCSHGYDAGNITGGYRAYLRLQLERFMKEEDARKEKTKEIERSLIKKFRKGFHAHGEAHAGAAATWKIPV